MDVEHQLIKVPVECAGRSVKQYQRAITKEVTNMLSAVPSLDARSPEQALHKIDELLEQLRGLESKMDAGAAEAHGDYDRCVASLEHLEERLRLGDESEGRVAWARTRTDRLVGDQMLREGYLRSAHQLAAAAGLEPFLTFFVFEEAKTITDALSSHDCGPALAWCYQNRAKLKKSGSSLEFDIRVQEYVEHLRAGRNRHAVAYAKKYLSPFGAARMRELRRVLGLLAFDKDTTVKRYARYYAESRWDDLKTSFMRDTYLLHGMPVSSPLGLTLRTGLSVLKTERCGTADANRACPACEPSLQPIVAVLARSHHTHSTLVCRVTGELMNEDNPPMVLPNGHVYGKNAVERINAERGRVVDPETGEAFHLSELKKAFIS